MDLICSYSMDLTCTDIFRTNKDGLEGNILTVPGMDQDERLEIRLPSQLKERVVRQAEEEYTTQSEVVRRALLAYLEDNKHEPPKSDD